MKFEGALYAVRDMAVARRFYEEVMGCKVAMDLGANLVFEGGPTLQQGFGELAGFPEENTVYRAYNGELYFETTDLDADAARLAQAGVALLHGIKEYPWGQRVLRCFDPDGHIVEVGESMDLVIARFLRSGMTADQVCQRTGFPPELVGTIQSQL